jgi:hypothetical protein
VAEEDTPSPGFGLDDRAREPAQVTAEDQIAAIRDERITRLFVPRQLERPERPLSSHPPDTAMPLRELPQPGLEVFAELTASVDQPSSRYTSIAATAAAAAIGLPAWVPPTIQR